jgi:membrane protease YdiL (CAAX protease family)
MVVVWFLLPLLIGHDSIVFSLIFNIIRTLIIVFTIPLVLLLSNKFNVVQKHELKVKKDISPFRMQFKLFKITKKNYKYQILHGLLLLFLVFIPLNFSIYLLFPNLILYQSISLTFNLQHSYLLFEDYSLFLIFVIIIQTSVSISEETLFRGFIAKRGAEHFNKVSAALISAYYFGFMEFILYLNPLSPLFPFWFPFIRFLSSFLIGLILSLTIIRKKWLLPLIFAHSINNILLMHIYWYLLRGNEFLPVILYLYVPLLVISLIILIWRFALIKESLSIGLNMLKVYIKNDKKEREENSDRYFRILFDIVIGFFIFLIGMLIVV